MKKKKQKKIHLILRDTLAIERTEMSNERTLYAGVRTSLTFFVAGVTILKFIDLGWLHTIAQVFILVSVILVVISIIQYIHNKKIIYKK